MKITESPRDAFQSINTLIPTKLKTKYINTLLRTGFDLIDIGSFVSYKTIPQMKDIKDIIKNLYIHDTNSKLLAITANKRGVNDLIKYDEIDYIGFPFSASKKFLKLNTNSKFEDSIDLLDDFIDLSIKHNKKILVYLSMAFGNPYGDDWSTELVLDIIDILNDMGIKEINLSDTIGLSTNENINELFSESKYNFPQIDFGFHLHTNKNDWYGKIKTAYDVGITNFDSVIGGHGGCPMTGYDKISNLNTLDLLDFCFDNNIRTNINQEWLNKSIDISKEIFDNFK